MSLEQQQQQLESLDHEQQQQQHEPLPSSAVESVGVGDELSSEDAPTVAKAAPSSLSLSLLSSDRLARPDAEELRDDCSSSSSVSGGSNRRRSASSSGRSVAPPLDGEDGGDGRSSGDGQRKNDGEAAAAAATVESGACDEQAGDAEECPGPPFQPCSDGGMEEQVEPAAAVLGEKTDEAASSSSAAAAASSPATTASSPAAAIPAGRTRGAAVTEMGTALPPPLPREDASCRSSSTATGSRGGGGAGSETSSSAFRGETVYVRDLHPSTTSEDLENFFSAFGKVVSARVVVNPVTREGRGFGFVSFSEASAVEETLAKAGTCGRLLHGRTVICERARRNRPHDPTPGEYRGPTSHLRPGFLPYWDLHRRGEYQAPTTAGGYDYKQFSSGPPPAPHHGGGGFFHHNHHPPYRGGGPYSAAAEEMPPLYSPPLQQQHAYYGRYAHHHHAQQQTQPHDVFRPPPPFRQQQQHYFGDRWRSRSPRQRT